MAITRQELVRMQRVRDQSRRRRRRRALTGIAGSVGACALFALMLGLAARDDPADPGAVAPPVETAELDLGQRPPGRVVARAGSVALNLPVDRDRAGATLFRSVDSVAGVALVPEGSWKHVVAPSDGREGPDTAAVDVVAPPGTIVFSPVNGTVASRHPYMLAGQEVGYQIDINPESAGDLVVRVRHIVGIPAARKAATLCGGTGVPDVGDWVRAGVSCLGQVRDDSDLVDVARPEVARYSSGGGHHVHMEVVRVN